MSCVLRRSAGALAATLLLLAAPGAFAVPCAGLPPTDLRLQPLSVDHVDEEVVPAAEIARLSTAIRGEVPHPLMAVRYTMDSNVAPVHRPVPAPGGGFCNAPERVVFGFGVTRRRVILAPEAATEACVKSALLAHEEEHYRFVREAIRAFLQEQKEALAGKLQELKRQPAVDEASARQAMEVGLLGASALLIQQFNKNVGQIREAIDSPTQLAALGASCNGRVAELERSIRRGEREL